MASVKAASVPGPAQLQTSPKIRDRRVESNEKPNSAGAILRMNVVDSRYSVMAANSVVVSSVVVDPQVICDSLTLSGES